MVLHVLEIKQALTKEIYEGDLFKSCDFKVQTNPIIERHYKNIAVLLIKKFENWEDNPNKHKNI